MYNTMKMAKRVSKRRGINWYSTPRIRHYLFKVPCFVVAIIVIEYTTLISRRYSLDGKKIAF
jgi:hypothetical protein